MKEVITDYTNEARDFCKAIKILASKPEKLDLLESYLCYHFEDWLSWANTPEYITTEMKAFAEMED